MPTAIGTATMSAITEMITVTQSRFAMPKRRLSGSVDHSVEVRKLTLSCAIDGH